MKEMKRYVGVGVLVVWWTLSGPYQDRFGPDYRILHVLAPSEGVFAYSRISSDGKFLAYASERPIDGQPSPSNIHVTVVDLERHSQVFSERGFDAYWSPDGTRLVFVSRLGSQGTLSIWNRRTRVVVRDIGSARSGDYPSWARVNQRDLIVTVDGFQYFLRDGQTAEPSTPVTPCRDFGTGGRPLVSRDGRLLSVFVAGTIWVRSRADCSVLIDTGQEGAKADFSATGRYISFHARKPSGGGYEIRVVDLLERTVRVVTDLPGSSLFPSWTDNGELAFRYDSDEFSGFLLAKDPLSKPARPLAARIIAQSVAWEDTPITASPARDIEVVMVWSSSWSSHSEFAAMELAKAATRNRHHDIGFWQVEKPSPPSLALTTLGGAIRRLEIPELKLADEAIEALHVENQMPSVLMFKNGRLAQRMLGAQTASQIKRAIQQLRGEDTVEWQWGNLAAGSRFDGDGAHR